MIPAFCQLRKREVLDPFGAKLIFIKVAAGCGWSSAEDDRLVGFWQHAILGQLIWEQTFYLRRSKKEVDRYVDSLEGKQRCVNSSEGKQQRASLREEFALSRAQAGRWQASGRT